MPFYMVWAQHKTETYAALLIPCDTCSTSNRIRESLCWAPQHVQLQSYWCMNGTLGCIWSTVGSCPPVQENLALHQLLLHIYRNRNTLGGWPLPQKSLPFHWKEPFSCTLSTSGVHQVRSSFPAIQYPVATSLKLRNYLTRDLATLKMLPWSSEVGYLRSYLALYLYHSRHSFSHRYTLPTCEAVCALQRTCCAIR